MNENSKISSDLTVITRRPQPTPMACHRRYETDLESREAVQAEIFAHLLAVMSYFGLKVFRHPAGGNLKMLKGCLEADAVT